MKKQLLLLSLLGYSVVGCQAATPTNAPKWLAQSDGFASVNALEQNGTTGGAGGQVVVVDNLADLEKYAGAAEPLVILIKGTIAKEPFGKAIKVTSNKTLLGLGKDATLLHGELQIQDASNIIFRNLTLKDSWMPDDPNGKKYDFDGFQIDRSHHIWIDHCTLTNMEDGLIDFSKNSDYLTVSWSVLSHHNKAFGIGWTQELGHMHVTMHHTWIHDTNQRNPSLDNGTGHLYNNYLQNITSYGNYSRGKSKVVVENSVFEKVNRPLSCDTDAELVERGNILQDSQTTAEDRAKFKGVAFNPKDFYAYQLDEAKQVPELVKQYAGPQDSIGTPEMGKLMANLAVAKPVAQVIVAQDGSGTYKTLQEAIAAVPDNSAERTVIHLKAGTYQGPFVVGKNKTNVTIEGDSPEKTILTYDKNVSEPRPEGAHIFNPGLDVLGKNFRAKNLTIENTSGDHGQALAARLFGDQFRFDNCRLLGWQDTILLDKGRYYFKDCYLEGRVDFIYGEGTAVFDNCEIHSKNGGYVTAASTKPDVPYGLVFLNSKLTGDAKPWINPATGVARDKPNSATDLGRPWRADAQVAFINCKIGDHIRPAGWNNWGKVENEKTARYVEYGSKTLDGEPLDVSRRVAWSKQLSAEEAAKYSITNVLGGWNPNE